MCCQVRVSATSCSRVQTSPTDCVAECDLQTSRMRRPWPTWGCGAKKKYFIHCSRGMQYLDYRVGIVFLCSRGLPEEGTLVPQHVGVWCLSCIVFYCVLGAFVGWYTDWKKKYARYDLKSASQVTLSIKDKIR